MNAAIMLWLLPLVLAILIVRALGVNSRHRHRHLPHNFDFDHYKTREINQRGVFDKTKWHY